MTKYLYASELVDTINEHCGKETVHLRGTKCFAIQDNREISNFELKEWARKILTKEIE